MIATRYIAGGLPVFRAEEKDYDKVLAFLEECRNGLGRKEFFYPYTEKELYTVITGGVFMCAMDGQDIAASFALDKDKDYADQLAARIRECTGGAFDPFRAYETSGLMVAEKYRRRGMARALMDAIIQVAADAVRGEWICGVVQAENEGSINTFLGGGFVCAGYYRMGGEYDFLYFARPAEFALSYGKEKCKVALRDMDGHARALAEGNVGVRISSGFMYYAAGEEQTENHKTICSVEARRNRK